MSESYDGPGLADALSRARYRTERDEELMRQALWALESAPFMFPQCPQTITALRERLGDKR